MGEAWGKISHLIRLWDVGKRCKLPAEASAENGFEAFYHGISSLEALVTLVLEFS